MLTSSQKTQIIQLLQSVYDPEMPVNIWDLGLIYGLKMDEKGVLTVVYTLTSPNCPAIDLIPQQIEETLLNLDFVNEVNLELTWDPPWSKNLLSEEIKLELGM